MHRFWLMAGGAGLASAAAFLIGMTAVYGGSFSGVMLVYLSPAPLFAASLGLGGSASIVAAMVGVVPVTLAGGLSIGLGYAAVAAVPAAVLGRQAMLSRTDEAGVIEWYPEGALAGWHCIIGAGVYTLFSLLLASQPDGLSGTTLKILTQLADWMQVSGDQREMLIALLHPILPGFTVASWMLLLVANGALAQGLLSATNRALRPSPDLGTLELPNWIATAGAAAALAAVALDGDPGYFARNLVIIAAIPFFLQGLSVVHVLARRTGGGAMMLVIFYVMLIVLGWVAFLIVLLGLVEQIIGLRRRMDDGDRA